MISDVNYLPTASFDVWRVQQSFPAATVRFFVQVFRLSSHPDLFFHHHFWKTLTLNNPKLSWWDRFLEFLDSKDFTGLETIAAIVVGSASITFAICELFRVNPFQEKMASLERKLDSAKGTADPSPGGLAHFDFEEITRYEVGNGGNVSAAAFPRNHLLAYAGDSDNTVTIMDVEGERVHKQFAFSGVTHPSAVSAVQMEMS